jgi:hypothetical protein
MPYPMASSVLLRPPPTTPPPRDAVATIFLEDEGAEPKDAGGTPSPAPAPALRRFGSPLPPLLIVAVEIRRRNADVPKNRGAKRLAAACIERGDARVENDRTLPKYACLI